MAGQQSADGVRGLTPTTLAEDVAYLEAEHDRLVRLVWDQAQEITRLREEIERVRSSAKSAVEIIAGGAAGSFHKMVDPYKAGRHSDGGDNGA